MKRSVFDFIAITIEERTGIPYNEITPDRNIRELCDSLDLVSVLEIVEKRYGIFIETMQFDTVGDLSNIVMSLIDVR